MAAATTLLLAGCSSDSSQWSDYLKALRLSLGGALKTQAITRQQAAAIPYASLGFRVDGGNEQILVLATDNNDSLLWTASSHIVLMTRGGRVVRSIGLPRDRNGLIGTGAGDLQPLSDALRAPYRSTRIVDIPDGGGSSLTVSCLTRSIGRQSISILGTAIATARIDETCQSQKPRWRFTDNYWLDPDSGFAWHSIQHLHPSGETLQIEVFRPPE